MVTRVLASIALAIVFAFGWTAILAELFSDERLEDFGDAEESAGPATATAE